MLNKNNLIKSYAVIGYILYEKGKSIDELINLKDDEVELFSNEFEEWIKNFKGWEEEEQ